MAILRRSPHKAPQAVLFVDQGFFLREALANIHIRTIVRSDLFPFLVFLALRSPVERQLQSQWQHIVFWFLEK